MALGIKDTVKSLSFSPSTPIDLSPDGIWVAYTIQDPFRRESPGDNRYSFFSRSGTPKLRVGCDVWITNTSSGESRCLTQGKGSSWGPVWSPNGDYLAFFSDRDGQAQLWVWERSSDRLRRRSDVIVRSYYGSEVVRWMPDSQKILCKVLPEGMTLEDGFDLIISHSRQMDEKKSNLQSSVIVYHSPKVLGMLDPPRLPKNNVQNVAVTNIYLSDLAIVNVFTGKVERIACQMKIIGYWISPDGTKVACTVLKEDSGSGPESSTYDLLIIFLSNKQIKVVASEIQQTRGISVSWSPDGKLLSYISRGNCFIVSASEGKPRNLTKGSHSDFYHTYRPPLWDAEGKNLYFLVSDTLWRISVLDATVVPVTHISDRELVEVVSPIEGGRFWSPQEEKSLFLITQHQETKRVGISKVNLTTGLSSKVLEEDAKFGSPAIYMIDVSDDSQQVVYTRQDAQRCEDIWIAGIDFRDPRRLTNINPSICRATLGTNRLIEWRDMEGQTLRGALLFPPNYETGKQYPLVVYVYGGSWMSSKINTFGLEGPGVYNLQLLATRGYVVLCPDAPLQVGTPMQDIAKTVLPGVNKAVEMGIADPDRLGVIGHSYGGYSTLALVTQTTCFKAAVISGGYSNLISMYNSMRKDGSTYGIPWAEEGQGRIGGTPWRFRNRYIENSPIFYFDRVQTPLLVIHGALDYAVPSFLADEVFVALRRLGKQVAYAKYEGELHAPSEWGYANQIDYWKRIIVWFDRYLKIPK